ncbi:MAG: PTS sugar transporter subunit IIA [Pseudomonadota bacterium]
MQLSVRDVAKLFNVAEKTIYRWLQQGKIPAYKINDQYRFNKTELLEWATAQKIQVSPAIFSDAEESVPLPMLHDAIEMGGIHYRVDGGDRASVLRAIVKLIPLPQEVDREFLLQVLLARESLGSTAIGDGIAIPHVRTPIVMHILQPLIAVCFLEHPIDFEALDGKPVKTLFTLISPTIKAHLHLLSRLSFALGQKEFRQSILHQAARSELIASAAHCDRLCCTTVKSEINDKSSA